MGFSIFGVVSFVIFPRESNPRFVDVCFEGEVVECKDVKDMATRLDKFSPIKRFLILFFVNYATL
jgi:hypothetical protein